MSEQEIFLAAVEISNPQARQAFLDQACRENPALRQQVEALLKVHAAAGDFLDVPAVQQLSAKTTVREGDHDPATNSAEYEKTHGYTQETPAGDEAVSLDFLSPSEKAGSLGKLGHYEVHELLGRGAFGIVLKAFDEKLHRMVAIKVLSPELAKSSPPRKRFLREARSAAAVRHEHVVAIHAVEEQPLPYLVMEYIPGITLEQALHEHGPLDVQDVLRIGQQIACGLAAAHAQTLIHRDIKPSNILLENGLSGKVKISDFGLARTADDASMTQSGTIAGTPMYMSPEQATSGDIDQRSDLFSLGSVLYVMVSGRPPFRAATTLAVLKRVVDDTPRPIPTIIADTPNWLCAIIAKLQAKQPDERFATAQEVADLLGRCLADMQANRPVTLPAGMEIAEEKSVAAAERVAPLSASDDLHPPTPALPHPRTASSRRWPTIAALAVIALIGLGVTEATGITKLTSTVIRLTTGSGTLVIETDDPSVKVTIDGEEVSIQGAGVEQLTLKPGKYQIVTMKDGQPVAQQLVTITRGGKEVVRVTMEGIAVSTPVSRDPQGSAISSNDPDRHAAEWVLSMGGQIVIQDQSRDVKHINAGGELPRHSFSLTHVVLRHAESLDLAEFRRFDGCENLQYIDFEATPIDDAALEHFKHCRKLTGLYASGSKVTDAGLIYFRDKKKFVELILANCSITERGLSYFSDCKDLRLLFLSGSVIADEGLKNFRTCKNLERLILSNTKITDQGLENFQDCRRLNFVHLGSSPISDVGLAHFRGCDHLAELIMNGTGITDAGLDDLAIFKNLFHVSLAKTSVSDNGLSKLKKCIALERLDVRETKVTEAGVNKLAAALPKCRIEWDGGVIEPREETSSKPPVPEPKLLTKAERDALQWVVDNGGRLWTTLGETKRVEDLPADQAVGVSGSAARMQIVSLNLQGPQVTDAAVDKLVQLPPVGHLELLNCPLSDAGLKRLLAAPVGQAAQDLILRDLPITPDGMKVVPTMRRLNFIKCTPGTMLDAGVLRDWQPLSLTRLEIDQGQFGIKEFEAVAEMRHLESLQLSRLGIVDDGFRKLLNLSELTQLYLDRGRPVQSPDEPTLTDEGLQDISRLAKLAFLDLRHHSLTDEGLLALGKCRKLERLLLSGTKATEPGINQLAAKLPRCRIEWDGGVIEPTMTDNPDRQAAKWMLSVGGTIKIKENGEEREIKAAGDLPAGAWELTFVELMDNLKVTDAGLAVFQDCRNLREIRLGAVPVTEAGLAYFQNCKNLESLGLYFMSVSNAGLAHFQGCHRLRQLQLTATNCSDAGLAHFRDCKELRGLGLGNSYAFTDAGLGHFQDCRELRELGLTNTNVTDAGLANFQGCINLTLLQLQNTLVTDAGLAHFQGCKNLERLYLSNTQVTDAGLAHFHDCRKLMQLFLDSTQVTDADLAQLKNWPKLGMLTLGNTAISDAGLVDLVKLPGRSIHLINTRVSRSGFEQLKVARPDFVGDWSETNRTIAESVLALGGSVEIGTLGEPESRPVADADALPAEYFQVRRVSLAGVAKALEKLPELLSQLKYPKFDRLERIDLSGITGLNYEFLPPIHGLRELNLSNAGLTDITLAKLPKLPNLKRLVLDGNDLKGPGLASLKEQPALIDLSLKKTKVTAAKIDELKQALPKCRIEWDGGVIEPR